jgi:hypothetical protein
MDFRHAIGAIALATALAGATAHAFAQSPGQDAAKYPDWSGQWRRAEGGQNRYDPTKPPGRAQQIPLTAEYQAVYEAGLKDQADGGQGNNLTYRCIPGGLPRAMTAQQGIEFIVHAEGYLCVVQQRRRTSHLYRWACLAGRRRTGLQWLFDRQMA